MKIQTAQTPSSCRKIGYARVSTAEQSLDYQLEALKLAGCDVIYGDEGISGTCRDRPAFNKALEEMEAGDTLVVWKLDRMSRSLKHLIEIHDELQERGAFLDSITERLDTSTAMGKFVFQVISAIAELERNIISERTKAGLAIAASRGRYPGRPKKVHGLAGTAV